MAERLQRGGAVAEMLAAAWRIAIGKKLLPGRAIGKKLLASTLWQRDWPGEPRRCCWPGRRCCTIGKKLLAGAPLLHHREAATGREVARHHREEIGKKLKSTSKPHMELLVEEDEEDSILFCNFGRKI